MMYTCQAGCTDPAHLHRSVSAALMRGRTASVKKTAATAASAKKTPVSTESKKAPVTVRRRGKSFTVDIHCHYFNPEIGQRMASLNPMQHDPLMKFSDETTRAVNANQVKERAAALSSIETRLAAMDKMGIDMQAVSPAPPQYYYWTEPAMGAELAAGVNDRIAEIVAAHPDRFVGLGTVPLQDADLAVKELERAVTQLNLRGIEINTNVNGINLSDPQLKLEKFFRRVQELGVIIFMHPNGFTSAERLTHHYFNNVIGNPLDTTIAVSHLIFDGVIDRNPKLKIVLSHSGGFIGHYWARMDHANRARSDCRTVIKRAPSSYLKKFYFDSITFDPDMLGHSIKKWGADHVLLGTDYPYDMGETDPLGLIGQVPRLSPADRAAISGANAAKLLKLKVPRR